MTARVAAVSVNFRTEAEIEVLLRSLRGEDGRLGCPLVVVSNSGPMPGIGPEESLVSVVADGNLGYGRACNLGARRAGDVEYLAFVNPDVAVTAEEVLQLCDLLDANPDHGIMAAFTSPTERLYAPTGRVVPTPDDRSIGPLFVVRSELFRSLGGFDERFFLWFEDADLRLRASRAGWRVGFADGIVVPHRGGASYRAVDPQTQVFLTRAWLTSHAYFRRKWQGRVVAAAWAVGMAAANAVGAVLRRRAARHYVSRAEAVRFAPRLLSRIVFAPATLEFDGRSFAWW